MTGQRLPRAYRSRPRPSSALSAKASTVCPCSLDQKNTGIDVAMEFSRCARARARPTEKHPSSRPVSQNSTARDKADVEVDVLLGEPGAGRTNPYNRTGAYHRESAVSLERR